MNAHSRRCSPQLSPPAQVMSIGARHPVQQEYSSGVPKARSTPLRNVYRTHITAAAIFFVVMLVGTTWLSAWR